MFIIPIVRTIATVAASAGTGVIVGKACDKAMPEESEGKFMHVLGIIGKVAIVATAGAITSAYIGGLFPTESSDSEDEE